MSAQPAERAAALIVRCPPAQTNHCHPPDRPGSLPPSHRKSLPPCWAVCGAGGPAAQPSASAIARLVLPEQPLLCSPTSALPCGSAVPLTLLAQNSLLPSRADHCLPATTILASDQQSLAYYGQPYAVPLLHPLLEPDRCLGCQHPPLLTAARLWICRHFSVTTATTRLNVKNFAKSW